MAERDTISGYLRNFQALILKTEATDHSGRSLLLEEGIARAIAVIRELKAGKKKLMFVGNGGSAGISSHLAVDYWKMAGMRAMVFSDPAFLTCASNDYGYPSVFEKPLETFSDEGDGLVAISSSGKSDNILNAVKAARKNNLKVISFSGFAPANPLRSMGDVNFYVPSDAYNDVENLHMLLCTCILDCMISSAEARSPVRS